MAEFYRCIFGAEILHHKKSLTSMIQLLSFQEASSILSQLIKSIFSDYAYESEIIVSLVDQFLLYLPVSVHLPLSLSLYIYIHIHMYMLNHQNSYQISNRFRLLLKEAISRYVSVYTIHSQVLYTPLDRCKVIPPLYDLILSSFLSHTTDETFLLSFENEMRDRYFEFIHNIAELIPYDISTPRLLLDLPCFLYNQIPSSLKSQLSSAVMDELSESMDTNGYEFVNQSHFRRYFRCKLCVPSPPSVELPYLLTPASAASAAVYSSQHIHGRHKRTYHSISETVWAKSLNCSYNDMLVKTLQQHAFSHSEATRISDSVFDSAARLALHRATISQLYKLVNEDLVRLIMEIRMKDCSSSKQVTSTDCDTCSNSSTLSGITSDTSKCYSPPSHYLSTGMH